MVTQGQLGCKYLDLAPKAQIGAPNAEPTVLNGPKSIVLNTGASLPGIHLPTPEDGMMSWPEAWVSANSLHEDCSSVTLFAITSR